jgi:Zn-dependent peptidase ImmA (M78 family)
MAEAGRYTRERLERIADDALRRAGAVGVVPTPLDAVAEAAGIEIEPIAGLAQTADRPLLGALWFEERTLFLERRQSAVRRRFTQAHELMHALCPWHRAILRTDTKAELFGPTRRRIEIEANTGAGLLLFGGSAFAAGPGSPSIDRALDLAARHAASVHATLHRCVQADRGASALLVTGRFAQRDGSLPVWRSVESPAFRRRLGRAGALCGSALLPGSPLRVLAEQARTSSLPPATAIRLGGRRALAQAHDNRHAVLFLLTLPA